MDYKIFTSPEKHFSLTLPINWEEYDDGDERTFAFFDANCWTGNLRITPFYRKQSQENENSALEFIQEELIENEGAVKSQLGDFNCAHYKRNLEEDGEQFVIYYWAVGEGNNLFICSLTIDKKQEQEEINFSVIKTVENIIASIRINEP